MIFTVPDDLKGSFVLGTLKRALSKGMSVSIDGDNLYAPDIKMAIKQGILIPVGDGYDKKKANTSHEVMVQNRTERVLVLDKLVLRPSQSLMVSRGIARSIAVLSAEKNGFVHIIYDEAETSVKKKATKKKAAKKKTTRKKAAKKKTTKKKVVKKEEEFVLGADREITAKVWNFRDQESEDAKLVPKTPDVVNVTEEEHEDADFIDEPLEAQEVKSKKKAATKKKVKKASKKKAAKKTIKKKGKATKKKKVKALEPVGDKRIPKTQMDAAIELDSRGRPLKNASDALNHLIDSLTEPEDMSFVDDEQAQDRYSDRTDMD